MQRARHHQRLFSALAFALLALVAELVGRSLTHRLDVGRHVATPSYAGADYYPILLAAVKGGIALLLARLCWRFARAHAAARAGRRLLAGLGAGPGRRAPRMRVSLSPRLWLAAFLVTALFYLVQTDAERLSSGRWPLLAPWLHTSALPVFAVLAVLVAILWTVAAGWLADYERFAEATIARARAIAASAPPPLRRAAETWTTPRQLFGLAFESRPPPAPA
ncbi:MAG TPA: hypothetical protein VF002_05160 [Gaiellaceae bacterium]